MIILKSSFQKILILFVVWTSFTCAEPNPKKLEKCKEDMIQTFGEGVSSLEAIQTAIRELILGFDHLSDDVTTYYLTFHQHVESSNIVVPSEYCFRVTKGGYRNAVNEEEVEEEEEEAAAENEEAEEGHETAWQEEQNNWLVWQGVAGVWYGSETVLQVQPNGYYGQETVMQGEEDEFQGEEDEFQGEDDEFQECESSFRDLEIGSDNLTENEVEEELSEEDKKLQACEISLSGFGTKSKILKIYQNSILYSAIYHHKQIFEKSYEHIIYANKCHLQEDGYGFDYLDYISNVIFLKHENMDYPEQFCIGKYGKKRDPPTLV